MNADVVSSFAQHLFTSDELGELSRTTSDRALAALAAGNPSDALEICRNASRNEHAPIRDVYMMWSAQTQSYIYRTLGIEGLRGMLHQGVGPWLKPLAELFRNGVTREAVQTLARLIRTECVDRAVISEDDATIRFTLNGWGEDRLSQAGCYAASAAQPLAVIREADPLTGNEPGTHIYRAVSFVAEAMMIDILGYPAFVMDENPGGADLLTIYKDPSAIPEHYYSRVNTTRDFLKMTAACSVAGGRLFDDAECEDMSLSCLERAAAAIERGDLKRAEGHCRLAQYEWYPGHHIVRDWMTGQLSWIDGNHPDIMADYFDHAYERSTLAPMQVAVKALDLKTVTTWFAQTFRQHAMGFHVEEDAEKITLVTHPCGSGGRLIAEGAYDRRQGLERIRQPSRATFGLDAFPSYCMHCPVTNRTLFEGDGPLYQIVDPALDANGKLTGHCKFYLYKGKDDAPEYLYRQVGLQKPPATA